MAAQSGSVAADPTVRVQNPASAASAEPVVDVIKKWAGKK
jgi:hypothetical protein